MFVHIVRFLKMYFILGSIYKIRIQKNLEEKSTNGRDKLSETKDTGNVFITRLKIKFQDA